jgi:hypothetical protein
MLARVDSSVLANAPGVVVILGGINDLQRAPTTSNIDNIKAMAAKAHQPGSG